MYARKVKTAKSVRNAHTAEKPPMFNYGVLSKCSQHQNIQLGYLLCETCELNNTPEILSDVSEVFD